jgi:hypothetical protein
VRPTCRWTNLRLMMRHSLTGLPCSREQARRCERKLCASLSMRARSQAHCGGRAQPRPAHLCCELLPSRHIAMPQEGAKSGRSSRGITSTTFRGGSGRPSLWRTEQSASRSIITHSNTTRYGTENRFLAGSPENRFEKVGTGSRSRRVPVRERAGDSVREHSDRFAISPRACHGCFGELCCGRPSIRLELANRGERRVAATRC